MSAGIKANNDGSAAIQVGGTDYITISSTGAVAMPVSLTIAGQPAGGNYALQQYVAPANWTKPTGLKAIKVTVVGAGGDGAGVPSGSPTNRAGSGGGAGGASIEYIPAPSIPGPVAVTAGPGTNSFGAFCSATAGSAGTLLVGTGTLQGGIGGVGSGGSIDIGGGDGGTAIATNAPNIAVGGGFGGSSILGGGGRGGASTVPGSSPGDVGSNYGGGGGGGAGLSSTGGTGAPGIVIVEEFY